MSDTPEKKNNNNRRNHYKKGGKNNKHKASTGNKPSGAKPNKPNSNNKNRRPKSLTPSRVIQKHENLLDQHVTARRKLYEMHGRANAKQLTKIENNFTRTLKAISNFADGLKDWQKEVLDKKLNFFPEDRQFSTTHDLEPVGDEVEFEGSFEDPHLLATQKEKNWQEDQEESEGSMADYYSYKGIEPPTKVEKQ